VANIIRCDRTAAAVLEPLKDKYNVEMQAIRDKLDELDAIYREVDNDASDKYDLNSSEEYPRKQAITNELDEHLKKMHQFDLKRALQIPQAEIEDIQAKIKDAKSNRELKGLKEDLLNRQGEFDRAFMMHANRFRGDAFVQGMITKYHLKPAEQAVVQQDRVAKLHEHLQNKYGLNLKEALQKPQAEIAKARVKIREANSFNELENLRTELKAKQQEYDKAILLFINPKRGDVIIRSMIEEIESDMTVRGKELRGSGRPSGTWETKQWGLLLMPKDTKEAVASYLGKGFAATVNKLKERKHEIKREMHGLDIGNPKYAGLDKELKEINRTLYHCILTRSLDVIADKEWQIRQPGLDPMQKAALEYDILKLNAKFQSILAKYSDYKEPTRSLKEAFTEETKNTMLNVISCGFYNGKIGYRR